LILHGEIRQSTPNAARILLREIASSYLAGSPDLDSAVRLIDSFDFPPDTPIPFAAPHLISPRSRAYGKGNPRLDDDLTEIIYGAYHALKFSGVKRPHQAVMQALKRAKADPIAKRQRGGWTYTDVRNRLKAYEDALRRGARKSVGASARVGALDLRKHSEMVANKWIWLFRPLPDVPLQRSWRSVNGRPRF
jgi:hypothetical protein